MHCTGAVGAHVRTSSVESFQFLLRGLQCNGSEEHLTDCPRSEIESVASCSYVGVVYCAGRE